MVFTVKDYQDLARLLREHPEWREELRRLVLSEELLALPEIVRELALAQRRTEEGVGALAAAQQRTEERVNTLTEQVRLLTEGQERLTEQVRLLTEGQQRLTDTVGGLKGWVLERIYADRAGAYFGRLLRQVKVVEVHTLEDQLEAALTAEEFHDVLLLDVLVRGRVRRVGEGPEVWLAVEVSAVVDQRDVERAVRRAGHLRKAGYRVVPVVAGEGVTQGGQEAAGVQRVALVQDGGVAFWPEALAGWEDLGLEGGMATGSGRG